MSQVVRTPITCSHCGQPFQAIIEQIIDVGRDPQAKARFLSGRVNMITCPNCGHTLAVGTPLIYHDPAKELLLVYVPMELNVTQDERERVIGELTRRVTDSTPPEQRKGYLFQPRQALTIPGMIDTILEADGVTAEMREAQREKLRIMELFLQVGPDQWPTLIEEHDALIDEEFFQMLIATAETAAETGKEQMAQALLVFYNYLIENTTVGQQALQAAQTQENVVREVAQEIEALGENLSRDDIMHLALSYADHDDHLQALVGLMRPAFDYVFFQELTNRLVQAPEEDRDSLTHLRSRLLELTAAIDQQTQVVIKRATDTLRVIANSEDLDAAIRPRLDQIDDTFLAVLQANIRAAEEHQDQASAARLKEVLEKALEIIRENAPPHIRFINELMTADNEADSHALIEAHAARFGPELLELMEAIAQDLEDGGQLENARRLRDLSSYASHYIGSDD